MIRKLLATTALVTITAGGAYAADGQTSDRFLTTADNAAMASTLIGESVYTSSAENAESVGEINDLLVGSDGDIDAAIIGVGGFLGLGEKNVAVSYDNLTLTADDDGTYYVVLETSKEELESAPEFDVNAVMHKEAMAPDGKPVEKTASAENKDAMAKEPKATDQMAAADSKDAMAKEPKATDQMAAADNKDAMAKDPKANDQMAAADNKDAMAKDPKAHDQMAADGKDATLTEEEMAARRDAIAAGREDYAVVDVATMGTDDLIGASVYSYDNDNVGEIGEILLTEDGKTDAIVIDVGGFLGIGEKPVAVSFDAIDFRADENGTLYVYTKFTEEQLESANEYDEEAYKQNRDQVVVKNAS